MEGKEVRLVTMRNAPSWRNLWHLRCRIFGHVFKESYYGIDLQDQNWTGYVCRCGLAEERRNG